MQISFCKLIPIKPKQRYSNDSEIREEELMLLNLQFKLGPNLHVYKDQMSLIFTK